METLGLKTIGKRGKFLEKTKEIAGRIIPSGLLRIFSLSIVALIIGCVGCCFCLTWHGLEPTL